MKKNPRSRAGQHTGGVKGGHMAGGMAKSTSARGGMHSGGVYEHSGPKGPKGTSSRMGKHTGGKKMGSSHKGGSRDKSMPKGKTMSREKFIAKAEEALGDTEF